MVCGLADKYLRLSDVEIMTGVSRASVYGWMRKGEFPRGRAVGGRATRWLESEILEWMRSKPVRDLDGAA